MREAGMRVPIHTGYFFRVELHLLMKRAAQRVEHGAFDSMAKRLRVNYQSAVVSAYQALHPNVAGLAIHFDFSNLCRDGLAAKGVSNAASGQDVSRRLPLGRGTIIPTVSFRRRLEGRNGSSAPETRVIGGTGCQEFHTKLQGIGFRRVRHFVDERFGSE